jgi:alpha-tubulin suppressor-like RCC1 family protein
VSTKRGQLHCWGFGDHGQLGHGSWDDSAVPVPVSGNLTLARVVQGEDFACGLTTAGQAYCWGNNDYGQLGAGTSAFESNVPVPVGGVSFATRAGAFSVREDVGCGLTAANAAYCWGRNHRGQIGNATSGSSVNTPTAVSGGRTWQWIAAGDDFACGVATGGELYCWGSNADGKLGDGTTNDRNVPVRVAVPQGG